VLFDSIPILRTLNCMRIIAVCTLVAYGFKYPDAKSSITHWMMLTRAAKWDDPLDVTRSFLKAKALNGERLRFEIAGGAHRLIVAFDFGRGIAFIKFLGTLAAYDRVDALTVSQF
jgi:mRNA interferase HigB